MCYSGMMIRLRGFEEKKFSNEGYRDMDMIMYHGWFDGWFLISFSLLFNSLLFAWSSHLSLSPLYLSLP